MATPKWETETLSRLRTAIERCAKPLAALAGRDANEGDTRLLVTDFLCDGFGYDKYSELTTEYQVRGEFADYAIRIDEEMVAFVEVKRIKTKLNQRHLRQVEMYALNEGIEWVVLTNGAHWQIYHITAASPVAVDLAIDVDLLGAGTAAQQASELFFLTRQSLKRRQINDLWKTRSATSPISLASVIRSDAVTDAIRMELRRQTRQRVDAAEIARLVSDTVIRPELGQS